MERYTGLSKDLLQQPIVSYNGTILVICHSNLLYQVYWLNILDIKLLTYLTYNCIANMHVCVF